MNTTAKPTISCSAAKPATPWISAKEPDKIRERYGMHTFGQSTLMARRLIEAGTKFVQVNWPQSRTEIRRRQLGIPTQPTSAR